MSSFSMAERLVLQRKQGRECNKDLHCSYRCVCEYVMRKGGKERERERERERGGGGEKEIERKRVRESLCREERETCRYS